MTVGIIIKYTLFCAFCTLTLALSYWYLSGWADIDDN